MTSRFYGVILYKYYYCYYYYHYYYYYYYYCFDGCFIWNMFCLHKKWTPKASYGSSKWYLTLYYYGALVLSVLSLSLSSVGAQYMGSNYRYPIWTFCNWIPVWFACQLRMLQWLPLRCFKVSATLQDSPHADRCSTFIFLINSNKPHIFWKLNSS